MKLQPPQLYTRSLEEELQKEVQITANQILEQANLDRERKILSATIVARRVISRGSVGYRRKIPAHRSLPT